MEKEKVLVATYKNLSQAQQVISVLEQNGCKRADIGLAVSDDVGDGAVNDSEALVTVSVANEDMMRIQQLMELYRPLKLDVRNAQWRLHNQPTTAPNEDDFIAVDRAKKQKDK